MTANFGLGTMMYSPLAGGLLTVKYRKRETSRLTAGTNSECQENDITKAIIDKLFLIAEELGKTPGQVAFAWVLTKGAFPIVGARTVSHINHSLKSAQLRKYKSTQSIKCYFLRLSSRLIGNRSNFEN